MKQYCMMTLGTLIILLIACISPTEPNKNGFERSRSIAESIVVENLMPWVDALAETRATDEKVTNEGFPPSDLFPSGHLTRDNAVTLVFDAFQSMGYDAEKLILGEGSHATYNVIAELPGTLKTSEVVVLASHLDAFYSGADDNGSAVAAMLEIARAFRDHQFARTIRFIAFDLEEFGSIGSTRYIEGGYANDVKSAIVLDMIGYASEKAGSQDDVMGVKLPETGDFLLVVGNEDSSKLTQQAVALSNEHELAKVVGIVAPGDGTYFLSSVFMRSDHGLFWYEGIPTLFFTDTANFRNPNYHKISDTPETLDPEFLARNTRAIAAMLAQMAEARE